MSRRKHLVGAVRPAATWATWRLALGCALSCLLWATPATVRSATEVDRNAFWIESAVCTVVIKTPASIGVADPTAVLGALVSTAASCTGNVMAQIVPGGVSAMLQRGFRLTTAHHQIVLLPARGEADAAWLVTGLFALERPAVKPPPIPK